MAFEFFTANCVQGNLFVSFQDRGALNKFITLCLVDCLSSENNQNFLEESKLFADVACVVYPIFMILGMMQEYQSRLAVLPDSSMYSTIN